MFSSEQQQEKPFLLLDEITTSEVGNSQIVNSVKITSKYSIDNNVYKTELLNKQHQLEQSDLIAKTNSNGLTRTSKIVNNNNNGNFMQQSDDRITNIRKTESNFLTYNIINICQKNCFLTLLLGATLFASITNTFLLSLIVRSIQLNDKGLMNGRLYWDDSSDSSVFQIPTELAKDKSIFLDSIESTNANNDNGQKSLILEILSNKNKEIKEKIYNENAGQFSNVNFNSLSKEKFLFTGQNDNNNYEQHEIDKQEDKSNYMAVIIKTDSNSDRNNPKEFTNERLEIGTKLLVLNSIIGHHNSAINNSNLLTNNNNENGRSSKWLATQQLKNLGYFEQEASSSSSSSRRLLVFNDEQQSITLPSENKLNLVSATKTSSSLVVVNGKLKSSSITGSLNRNLDIQTRNGGLKLESEFGNLNLLSKSSNVQLISNEELLLKSGNLIINSNQLYISKGIKYFDKEPATSLTENKIIDEDDIRKKQSEKLKAFNLCSIGGILMAA